MYKIKYALKKGKKVFIIGIILWVILSIGFIAPLTVSSVDAKIMNKDFFSLVFENFGSIRKHFR